MLKTLLKKQLLEMFQGFFKNRKTGKARTRTSTIVLISLYVVLMVGILGGMFTMLAYFICEPLDKAGMSWMYFMLFAIVSTMLGIFGSVFNTYASLYGAKDNDLLLSMPIPERYILTARLLGVYLMGLMFSSIVMLPCIIVYFIKGSVTPSSVVGSILLLILISIFILTLSCILGWLVAKISGKLKNKSIVTVLISVAFIGIYYYVCLRANEAINALIENAAIYGEKIKGIAYPLYLVGNVGAGDVKSIAVLTAVVLVLFAAVVYVLARSFIKIVTFSASTSNKKYKEKTYKAQNSNIALLKREIKHFTSSATYMLNGSLGTLFLLVVSVAILIKQKDLMELLGILFEGNESFIPLVFCALICMIVTMNYITAPSISLEGKSIWLSQSLPVKTFQILFAKINLHLVFTLIPAFICSICTIIAIKPNFAMAILLIIAPLTIGFLCAVTGLILNLKMPNLNWMNETAAVKQSFSVLISMFAGWGYIVLVGVCGILTRKIISPEIFLLLAIILTASISALLVYWLKTRGTKIYQSL